MSDRKLLDSIKAMEDRLEADPSTLDAETLEAWNREFKTEAGSAERGPEWPAIVARAEALSQRIQAVTRELLLRREELKRELGTQTVGQRALKAYDPKG